MTAATEASAALCLLDGARPRRVAPSPPPRRRRPRPRPPPPPPPRAARSVPAARLGRSAPPLSSARCYSRRRAPAAAAASARADGGPGVLAVAAALLRSLGLRLLLRGPTPPLPSPPPSSRRLSLSGRAAPGALRPAPGLSPALTCALRSRRGRDVGWRRNAPLLPLAPPGDWADSEHPHRATLERRGCGGKQKPSASSSSFCRLLAGARLLRSVLAFFLEDHTPPFSDHFLDS